MFLIVGLGNPGEKYAKTRHNLGFMVAQAFADKHGLSFKRGSYVQGEVASGQIGDEKVSILMPSTYMNLSGGAVKKCIDHYAIPLQQLLVIVDDIYLEFGTMRLQPKGGAKGHNGLKSIDAHVHTQEYPRLRMGVGGEALAENTLEAFVLDNFEPSEQQILPQVIEAAVSVVEGWLTQG